MSTRHDRPARPWPTLRTLPAAVVASALLQAFGTGPGHAASGDIYRAVQADGTVVFTDRAKPDATLVRSRPPRVAGTGEAPGEANATTGGAVDVIDADPRSEGEDGTTGLPIERVEIASPPPDATLVDPVGPLLVEIGTAPGSLAASGLVAEALVDGEVVASGTSPVAVPTLERGEHRLAVRLVDTDGTVVVESDTQSLHVRRSFTRPSPDDER